MAGSQGYSRESAATIRVGVVDFGTLAWELATIENEGLAENRGIRLEQRPVASPQSGKIALQSGAVDIIVSDWIWVAGQRAAGADFTFAPYSTSAGALIVPRESSIYSVGDLDGTRLGVAGGELDKNWVLLRGLAQKQYHLNLDRAVTKVFAAAPLLNEQMLRGNLDALFNYWHYAVRLEAIGYRRIVDGDDILRGLGIEEKVASLGYVFGDEWARANKPAVTAFLEITHEAKQQLCDSDAAWERIVPLFEAPDPKTRALLRLRYCEGRVGTWTQKETEAAQRIYALLHALGGERLAGKQLPPGTFWSDGLPP